MRAYLIQFGNIMPIERINDYRGDMKLSRPAGRVNCHYPLFPTEERENARGFLGPHPRATEILIINRTRSSSQSATAVGYISDTRVSPSTWNTALSNPRENSSVSMTVPFVGDLRRKSTILMR